MNTTSSADLFWTRINYFYLLLIALLISVILTMAMVLQYQYGEIPCPLCLLQRLAYFGICFGIMMSFRYHYSLRHIGLSALATLYLLVISTRQSLLNVIPRPGHHWIGSPILGIHLSTWSIIFSLILLLAFASALSFIKQGDFLKSIPIKNFPILNRCAMLLSFYIMLLCLINLISVFLQCGFHICHTYNYQLLQ